MKLIDRKPVILLVLDEFAPITFDLQVSSKFYSKREAEKIAKLKIIFLITFDNF